MRIHSTFMGRQSVLPISFLSIILGLTGCQRTSEPVINKDATVYTRVVQTSELFEGLSYPAHAASRVNTHILAEIDGIVASVDVKLGSRVQSKQSLIVLSHTDPVYQYTPVQVLSPISGSVSSIDVNVGSHVVHGQTLISVMDPSQIELVLELPVQDLPLIKKGTRGEFRIAEEDLPLPIVVQGTSPTIDANTGTARAQLGLLEPKKTTLSPGVQGHVSFKVNVHQGISISDNAIIYKGSDPFVRLVKNGKITLSSVRLGKRQRGMTEVIRGVLPQDEVVERSSRFVAEGEKVKVDRDSNQKQ